MRSRVGADDDSIRSRLLAYLRETLSSEVAYADPPNPLTGGFDTRIFSFELSGAPSYMEAPLVLRLMPRPDDGVRVLRERAIHEALVEQRYPAPRAFLACTEPEVLRTPFLIMERLPGENLWENALGLHGRRARLFSLTRKLAEAHARLHSLDPEPLERRLGAVGADLERSTLSGFVHALPGRVEAVGLPGLRDGARWLVENLPPRPAAVSICHGDFHPLNVIAAGDALSGVVDWSQAIVGDPAYDVAATTVLLRFGPTELTGLLRALFDRARALPIRRYRGFYKSFRTLDSRRFRYYECVRVLSALAFAGESLPDRPNPWRNEYTVQALSGYFHRATRVRVQIAW